MGGSTEKYKEQMKKKQLNSKDKKTIDMGDPEMIWNSLSEREKVERVDELWDKARRFNSKLRF